MKSKNGDLGWRKSKRFAENATKARQYASRRQERFALHMLGLPRPGHRPPSSSTETESR